MKKIYIIPTIEVICMDTSYMVMTSGTGKYVYTRSENGEVITTTSDTRQDSTWEKIWKGLGGHGYDPNGNQMFSKKNNLWE